jgi:transcription initiation factor TFIIB
MIWMENSTEAKPKGTPTCSECGGSRLIQDPETGETICQTCGFVVSSTLIDHGPEWRAFEPEQRENMPRVGAPASWILHDKGLSTTIGWENRDAMGKRLHIQDRARLQRLRMWQRRSKTSDSQMRNLAQALSEMSKVGGALNLPRSVTETAAVLYRRAVQSQLIRGRSIQSVSIACVYMACRQCRVTRSLDDVAAAAGIARKDAARTYRFLLREMGSSVPLMDPESYIGLMVNRLGLAGETERLAKVVLARASEMKLTNGRGPQGIAAACVYISCQLTDERRTQGQIAREAQITEVTIRNRYKELAQRLEFNIQL